MFDTKRNPHVLRGRKEQEELAKRKQESVMDLELDLLAPYLERYPDVNSLSKAQVNPLVVKDNFGILWTVHRKNTSNYLSGALSIISIRSIDLCGTPADQARGPNSNMI